MTTTASFFVISKFWLTAVRWSLSYQLSAVARRRSNVYVLYTSRVAWWWSQDEGEASVCSFSPSYCCCCCIRFLFKWRYEKPIRFCVLRPLFTRLLLLLLLFFLNANNERIGSCCCLHCIDTNIHRFAFMQVDEKRGLSKQVSSIPLCAQWIEWWTRRRRRRGRHDTHSRHDDVY